MCKNCVQPNEGFRVVYEEAYNLWTVLEVLQEYMKVSGITSDHTIETERRHVFIIQHETG